MTLADAHLDWLPQGDNPVRPFRPFAADCRLAGRRGFVPLAGGGCPWPARNGRNRHALSLTDRRKVMRQGVPVLFEPLTLGTAALGAGIGVLQGAGFCEPGVCGLGCRGAGGRRAGRAWMSRG